MQIANTIGHILQPDARRDQGIARKFNASHAKKRLIGYFINGQVFLENEIKEPENEHYPMEKEYATVELLVEAFQKKAKLESDEGGPLRDLATVMPPVVDKKRRF
jgi:hypothetical protein